MIPFLLYRNTDGKLLRRAAFGGKLASSSACCCGVIVENCCPGRTILETLNVSVITNCGTYTGTITYDPDAGGGTATCWVGSVEITCRTPGPPPEPCTTTMTLDIQLCCVHSSGGWTITLEGTQTNNATVNCDPFEAVQDPVSLPSPCNLETTASIVVTE